MGIWDKIESKLENITKELSDLKEKGENMRVRLEF